MPWSSPLSYSAFNFNASDGKIGERFLQECQPERRRIGDSDQRSNLPHLHCQEAGNIPQTIHSEHGALLFNSEIDARVHCYEEYRTPINERLDESVSIEGRASEGKSGHCPLNRNSEKGNR